MGTMRRERGPVSQFLERHFLHFNAATLVDAARAYEDLVERGGKMLVALAGAMSTAELGRSLAEMIRRKKVHLISCTGANLEEDVMNLIAHSHYKRIPNYRDLTPADELQLLRQQYNRVTDTCIPEEEAFRRLQGLLLDVWTRARDRGERFFPHEYFFQLIRERRLEPYYEIDPRDSWVVAAAEHDVPIVVPGWEDSTCGNIFAAYVMKEALPVEIVRSGIEYMVWLALWYSQNARPPGVGFLQIGGGIAGDFPICVVPLLHQDLGKRNVPLWSYFCQISDSTTSYGSYSGAVPNEKITWGKLGVDTPRFMIESDATIVAPLLFAWVLGW